MRTNGCFAICHMVKFESVDLLSSANTKSHNLTATSQFELKPPHWLLGKSFLYTL